MPACVHDNTRSSLANRCEGDWKRGKVVLGESGACPGHLLLWRVHMGLTLPTRVLARVHAGISGLTWSHSQYCSQRVVSQRTTGSYSEAEVCECGQGE